MISQGFILIHYTQLADGLHKDNNFQSSLVSLPKDN